MLLIVLTEELLDPCLLKLRTLLNKFVGLTCLWTDVVKCHLLRNNVGYFKRKSIVGNKKKVEMQMFYVGLMVFVTNMVFTIYFFMRDNILPSISGNSHFHEWILYFISDIYDLPNGLVLWLTSASNS
ncbi:hypothetical protein M3Y97_01125700 [Aphelenchoides bicaudatus]|nr:hypothetical protein M3Y97_01125700 [Aphelenchoides bicaudatus]